MQMIKILIIDDLPKIRSLLTNIINQNCDDVKIVGYAEDVKTGVSAIQSLKPDIILLDVNLPDGTGFDILRKVDANQYNFHIIFITAYEEYAVKAFKYSTIDYILKPVEPTELLNAIKKFRGMAGNEFKQKIETFSHNSQAYGDEKKLVLKTHDTVHSIEMHNIVRCQSADDITTFYLIGNDQIVVNIPIREYEGLLNEFGFFRVHPLHLINLGYVKNLDKGVDDFVVMTDETRIPISPDKKELFRKQLRMK